jgi:hypothetical protein
LAFPNIANAHIEFTLLAPQSDFLTSKDTVWVQLQCLSKIKVSVGSKTIVCPGPGGVKSINVPLKLGKNQISVQGRQDFKVLKVFRTYSLDWSHADERYQSLQILLARIAPPKNYDLKKNVTRAEMAYVFDQISFYKTPDTRFYAIKDINEKTPYYSSIKRVVESGWLGIDDQNQFYPDKKLTRIEMLAAILRYGDMRLVSVGPPVPFKDISLQHWGYPVALTALVHNIISGGPLLEPDQYITRMELLTTLLRLPEMTIVLDPWK